MSSSITGIDNASMATKTNITDKATFGAAVVKNTLDIMNNTGSSHGFDGPITDKATFGAAVVTGTLDTLNSTGSKSTKNDYDFQNKVIGAGLTTGKGLLSSKKA